MSYINVSLTTRHADPARTITRMDAGFGREGGRLEHLTTSTSSIGVLPPLTRTHALTPALEDASAALLQAAQGAGWVQDVEVTASPDAAASAVSWTMRHGGGGSGADGSLPARVQAVVDAARSLEALVRT